MYLLPKILLITTALSLIFIIIGLGVGLGLFFGITRDESSTAKDEFNISILSKNAAINDIVSQTKRAVYTIRSMFDVQKLAVSPYEQFYPFMQSSQTGILGVWSLGWISHISNAQRGDFINMMRGYGQEYSSFNVMGRNMSGAMVPRGTFPSYDVLSYIHPLASNLGVLGFDLNVDPVRKDAIVRSTTSRSDAATGKIYLPHVKAQQPGVLYLSPIFNGTELEGFGVGVFIVGDMISAALSDLLRFAEITVFDVGTRQINGSSITLLSTDSLGPALANTSLWQDRRYNESSFIWTNQYEYSSEFGSRDQVSALRTSATNAPFSYRCSYPIGDRVWDIVFVPKDTFMSRYRNNLKWAALMISICISIVVAIIVNVVGFSLYVRWRQMEKLHKVEIALRERSAEEYRKLFEQMARIDTARKEILNTIPDIVIVVNSGGKVIYTNNTFSTVTGISDYDARSNLIVSRLFPQMKVDFFISAMQVDFIETVLETPLRQQIPVAYCTYPLALDEASFGDMTLSKFTQSGDDKKMTGALYVLIVRDMRTNKALISEIQNGKDQLRMMLQTSEFEQRWQSEKDSRSSIDEAGFRTKFMDFCKKNQSGENITFIFDVEKFKALPDFSSRDREAKRIIACYFSPDSQHQLNLTPEIISYTRDKVYREIGDIHIFDRAVTAIKILINTDIYPRFILEEKKPTSSSTSSSSLSMSFATSTK